MDYLPHVSRKKLREDRVFTLARLIAYGREKLLEIPGIGKKNLAEFERRLAQYGLSFDMRGSESVDSACDSVMREPGFNCL